MKFTLLGTGTSQGVPVIGCTCDACVSKDSRDNRRRCSAILQDGQVNIVIDVGPDFRQQMLDQHVSDLEAVFITHEHNDHVIGLDDLRPLIFRRMKPMKIYAERRVLKEIKDRFKYAFETQAYPGAPAFSLQEIEPGDVINIGAAQIEVVRVMHGRLPILGFIINDKLAYLTDTNHIPGQTKHIIKGIPILILDMLREKAHHSHFHLSEAIKEAKQLEAKSTYFIHMSHGLGPTNKWEQVLPDNVYPSYDRLEFDLQ